MSWKAAKTFPRWLIVDSTPRLRNVKRQKFLLSSIAVARNVTFVKIFTAAMEGSAPDPLLFGAHARRDTPEHFVNEANVQKHPAKMEARVLATTSVNVHLAMLALVVQS